MSKRSFEVTVRFFIEAETPEEAEGYVMGHIHRSLTGGLANELVEVIGDGPADEDVSE